MNNFTSQTSPIGLLRGQEGPRRSARNRADGDKSPSGTNSSTMDDGHQTWSNSQPGPPNPNTNQAQKTTRVKWTKEEYKSVVKAFYMAQAKPSY